MSDAQTEIAEQQAADAAKAEREWLERRAAGLWDEARKIMDHARDIEAEIERRFNKRASCG
jgi:hypothetical protein